MTDVYTAKEVSRDLAILVDLTKLFKIDNEGFWIDADTKKRYKYKFDEGDSGKHIVNYQDPLPNGDHYFFNPFSEGLGKKSPATTHFYRLIRLALNHQFGAALQFVASEVLASKEDNSRELSTAVVRAASQMVDKKHSLYDVIDETMIGEFEKITKRLNGEIINVVYVNNQMTAKLKIDAFTDPTWDEKYTDGVRKKSANAYKSLILGLLDIKQAEDINKFTFKYDPDLKSAAQLHAMITVYLRLYSKFNDILCEIPGPDTTAEDIGVNLGEIQQLIERFPYAYAVAKHMTQPTIPKVKPTDTNTVDTSGLRFENTPAKGRFDPIEVTKTNTGFGGIDTSNPERKNRFEPIEVTRNSGLSGYNSSPGFSQSQGLGFSGFSNNRFDSGFSNGGFSLTPPSNFDTFTNRRNYF